MRRALQALRGLAIGDAVGECLIGRGAVSAARRAARSIERPAPWPWTDDTAMAVSIVETLALHGTIDVDDLAARFARRYRRDPARGYGAGAHRILSAVNEGTPWRAAAAAAFDGQGSAGNGAAMRAAPIGAFFAGDLAAAAAAARASAAPTHAHPEGAAGAIAIAVLAAAVFAGERDPSALHAAVRAHTPDGDVARGLRWVAAYRGDDPLEVAATVGSGARVLAEDTVPFAVWCAIRWLGDFAGGVWACGDAGGDVDTTGAMVGGVVIGAVGDAGVPATWRASVEPLP